MRSPGALEDLMPRNPVTLRRERIQQSVSALRGGAQRRYPARLRSRIAEYSRERIKAGVALSRVCSEIGVSQPTLVRILDEKPISLRRVRVSDSRIVAPKEPLIVKGPGGIAIEGLDIEGAAALVRALS